MRQTLILMGLLGGLCGLGGCDLKPAPRPAPESREYRYKDGTYSDDHRNLQWRLEQVEAKLDTLLHRLPER